MAGFIESVSRDQTTLFPERLDDWVAEDNVARIVDIFVDALDLAALGFHRYAAARTGRAGCDPAVLLKLFIYGYLNRIPSSRRLEREAGRNVELMWLIGRLVPDHKTIADFRRDNGAAILADKGYFSAHEILACHEAGITATVPRSDTSGSRAKGHFVKADFAYEPGADVYRCPAGQALTHRTTTEQQGLLMRRYRTTAFKGCDLKDRCTTGHERRVSRWEHEHLVDASNARRRGSAAPMRVRRSTVEHPFGTIKAWVGHSHFLMRGLRSVGTEMALNVLAYNIKSMISLIGIVGLMSAIKG